MIDFMSRTSSTVAAFTTHKSFASVANHYDGFILDQFGVMHNGKEALPGATDCVKQLSAMGKKMIILSNTSAPCETALEKLSRLGFNKDFFQGAVTSGEEAARHIRERRDGQKALMFTWSGNNESSKSFLKKCGNIETTNKVHEADFLIAHGVGVVWDSNKNNTDDMPSLGSFMNDGDMSCIAPILKECQQLQIPMICANPDFVVKLAGGATGYMPGKIAERYEDMGGICTYFGKPHPEHFQACLRELNIDSRRVAHVGDSLHHDVAGASIAGIESIFITNGIHNDYLGGNFGLLPDDGKLHSLFEEYDQIPTHVLPLFSF